MSLRPVAGAAAVALTIGVIAVAMSAKPEPAALAIAPSERASSLDVSTSREGLERRLSTLEARVAGNPDDDRSAVALADALLRQARVTGDATLPHRAERVLHAAVADTDSYLARRMLGATYLAQHRFVEALAAGESSRALRPDDSWNYGVIGDAALELGRYDEAFAAFDRMAALKPSAASYARVAYARELGGDLPAALAAMQMAAESTSPQDAEAVAWSHVQVGLLHLQRGAIDDASRSFDRALFAFPGHPYALNGRARVAVARNDLAGAIAIYRDLYSRMPTPELAAHIGDILVATGDAAAARTSWAEAERLEREGWAHEAAQPAALARLLAERSLQPEVAVSLALAASRERDDIFTNDALAWSLFRVGRFEEAWAASVRSRRTGTKDRRILYHAAAIAEARGDADTAVALAVSALDGQPNFDLIAAPAARALLARNSLRASALSLR
jgi:tetratricopeptide (TPR) repeat protein